MPAANPLAGYLIELERMVAQGYTYDNSGPWRCDGSRHSVDCSGMVVKALNDSGTVQQCTNSYVFATLCHWTQRPQWMTDVYGPGHGTQITMAQALQTAGAWGFHGNDEGQEPDSHGDGHIKTSMGDTRSIEAMSHAAGVGYSRFDSPSGFITYCALPPMLLQWFAPPPPKVPPMMNKQLAAWLHNPDGGWWLGYDNGLVDYLAPDGGVVNGGMNSPNDFKNFAAHGEHLSQLQPRKQANGKAGYTIVSTDGNKYIPEAQA